MIRLCFIVIMFQLYWFAPTSNATIIPSNNYITYDQNNDGVDDYDIVWASSWAFQFYGCDTKNGTITNPENYQTTLYTGSVLCTNQFFAPGYLNDGWQFFENINGLNINEVFPLFNQSSFNDTNTGKYITGFQFWNTNSSILPAVNPYKFTAISDWTTINPVGIDPFTAGTQYYKNVFYARKSKTQSQPVPEPSTLFIFAIGLFALAFRLKRNTTL